MPASVPEAAVAPEPRGGTVVKVQSFTGGAFAENTYLAVSGGSAVIVDPGAAAPLVVAALMESGADLEAVLLTHAHVDHVEGLPRVLEHAVVPIHLHPADRVLYDRAVDQAAAFGLRLGPLPPPTHELRDGGRFVFGGVTLDVRHAPGHAPGHVLFHAADQGVAFVGDVVFRGSIGRTDLPGGDYRILMRAIREQVLTLPDETRLLTGHGEETTVGFERVGNPFLIPHYGGELA